MQAQVNQRMTEGAETWLAVTGPGLALSWQLIGCAYLSELWQTPGVREQLWRWQMAWQVAGSSCLT